MPNPAENETNELKKTGQVLKDTVAKISDAAQQGKATLLKYLEENTGQNKIGHLKYWGGKSTSMNAIYEAIRSTADTGAVGMFQLKPVIDAMTPFLKRIHMKPAARSADDGQDQDSDIEYLSAVDFDDFCRRCQPAADIPILLNLNSEFWKQDQNQVTTLTVLFDDLLAELDEYILKNSGLSKEDLEALSDPDVSEDELDLRRKEPELYKIFKKVYGKQAKDKLQDKNQYNNNVSTCATMTLRTDVFAALNPSYDSIKKMSEAAGLGDSNPLTLNQTTMTSILKDCNSIEDCRAAIVDYATTKIKGGLDKEVKPKIEKTKEHFEKEQVAFCCKMEVDWMIVDTIWRSINVELDMQLKDINYEKLTLQELDEKWSEFTSTVDRLSAIVENLTIILNDIGEAKELLDTSVEDLPGALSKHLKAVQETALSDSASSTDLESKLNDMVATVQSYYSTENWSPNKLGGGSKN